MPRYDYRCPKCGQVAPDLTTLTPPRCPCGEVMRRVWTKPAVKWNTGGYTVPNGKR